MQAISLFSGALGMDLGFEKAGYEIILAVENDSDCCATMRANRSEYPLYVGDVRTLSTDIKKPFVVFGGPPCQSFSTAGLRKSLEDTRGLLILEFLKVVGNVQPDYFVMENVKGLLYSGVIDYLYQVFQEIGYTVQHKILNAAHYGVAQRRERVIFIGSRDGHLVPFPVSTTPVEITLGKALAGMEYHIPEYLPYSPNRLQIMQQIPAGGNWRNLPVEAQKQALGNAYYSSGGRTGYYRRLSWNKASPTLMTNPNQQSTMLGHPTQDRPLSVQEYARIQQFPDDWVFAGNTYSKYRQIGNAVPVGLAYAVASVLTP